MSAGLFPASLKDLYAEASRRQATGAWDDAEALYLDILRRDRLHVDSLNQLGVIAYRRGRHSRAMSLLRSALTLVPGAAPLYYNCGLAAQGAGQSREAIRLYRRANDVTPGNADALCNIGNAWQSLDRFDEAEKAYHAALASGSHSARVHYNLALALKARGDHAGAEARYRSALALRPDYADALANLGNALLRRQDLAGAAVLFLRTTRLDRTAAETQFNLGNLERAQLKTVAAIDCYRASLVIDPSFAEAGAALAFTLKSAGRMGEAFKTAWRTMTLQPQEGQYHLGLADTMLDIGAMTDAVRFYRRAVALLPGHADALNNIANAQKAQGSLDEAVASLARALACAPDFALAHSNLLFTQLYRPQTGLADIAAGAAAWNAAHGGGEPSRPALFTGRDRAPKIGFLSADLRTHVVAHLVIPTIEALHERGHDLVMYHCYPDQDAMTDRFAAASSTLRTVVDLPDADLARQIREDGVDILIDLSGHTAGNRMPAVARRLASIQATWVGYPATTGISAMDYFLADHGQVPDTAINYFSESVIRFPDSYVCYEPVVGAPDPTPSPFLRNGHITFGSFNENVKITPAVLAAWSRILAKVPDSRLLFKSVRFDDPGTMGIYRARLAAAGIDSGRVDFVGRTSPTGHIAAMGQADIALDSFPYTGGATTLETLWMGVPVIALPGETMASRHSCGYLTCLGLTELLARSVDEYVEIACALAADKEKLRLLRGELRPRMRASSLCDRERFAHAFESALAEMWRRYRAGEQPADFDIPALHRGL